MNKFDEKAQRMKQHLSNHPADYQTVLSLFKAESDAIAYDRQQEKNLLLRELAKHMKAGGNNGE
ncbi:hypothetical protein [Enterococcus sp. BWR-S5]|uniref:hypothetical protein n=1 Tax=Enterococcus sp. BWR-S5 TaxID=2787714 RepID=UPI001922AA25|nr:hypothetical protein [Enterococcus sp. BWR-S5]MBL1226531.1 hypothetical protein [Enterococcus sp. BWR-S5]